MATYRTPDVYVEEISVFPPSVAEVETAIPAFIGYTARTARADGSTLIEVPTRATSLLEYESLFGGAPKIDIDRVEIDDGNNFVRALFKDSNNKYLYDSLRLFFDNGGGKCYIVSVGKHEDAPDKEAMIKGLQRIATIDEPTMLVFPDAAGMDSADLAAIQVAALNQCGKLKDRVTILDTARYSDKTGYDQAIAGLRDRIGINHLKYGAAYTPWLKLGYAKNVGFADLSRPTSRLFKGASNVALKDLTGDQALQKSIDSFNAVLDDVDGLKTRRGDVSNPAATLSARMDQLLATYKGAKTEANLQAVFAYLTAVAKSIDGMIDAGTGLASGDMKESIKRLISDSLKPAYSRMIAIEKELHAAANGYAEQWKNNAPGDGEWGGIFVDATSPVASAGNIPTGANVEPADQFDAALPVAHATFAQASAAWMQIETSAQSWTVTNEQSLLENFSTYRNIIRGINATLTACPPSGAIAGVYALVDNQRGVWKAPANVSLTGVIEPAYYLDGDQSGELNVDPNAGKSINAIRSFVGKGTLVWGARTLAGNDNEWRYVSVRRFFNMVEESVKKSTYWAVFEPNDANTWVKVRGMIENYLTQKWREGALAGATTKDAFFVRCGLGVTMDAQDVLEGRLNVEIGMAVVRPAEFIVLKFSHKLQTS